MMSRVWLFIAGLSGCASLIAATYGVHGLNGATTFSASVKIYDTASLQHALHSIAIAVTAVLLVATEGRRNGFGTVVLNIAAVAFLAGIVLFSGLLYYQIVRGVQDYMRFVPVGASADPGSSQGVRRMPKADKARATQPAISSEPPTGTNRI